jgi:hypothetical protein
MLLTRSRSAAPEKFQRTVSARSCTKHVCRVCPRVVDHNPRVAGSENPAPRNSSVPPRRLVKASGITLRGAVQVKRRLGGKATSCKRSITFSNLFSAGTVLGPIKTTRSGAMAQGCITGSSSQTRRSLQHPGKALVPGMPQLTERLPDTGRTWLQHHSVMDVPPWLADAFVPVSYQRLTRGTSRCSLAHKSTAAS